MFTHALIAVIQGSILRSQSSKFFKDMPFNFLIMTTVYDVNANALIDSLSESLKKNKNLQPPGWTRYVKTGAHKERPPQENDWWFKRLAAILRSVYVRYPIGVQRLRTKFGGRRKRGYKPKKHFKAGGKIIRTAIQILESEGLLTKVEKKGRVLTKKGVSMLDKHAAMLVRSNE